MAKTKIFSREFKESIAYAFPRDGKTLQIELRDATRDYLCRRCGKAEQSFHLITMDAGGYPASLHARKLVYAHFVHHEIPTLSFDRMTDYGRRMWFAKKLGYKTPPRNKSVEDLRALVKLVTSRRTGR